LQAIEWLVLSPSLLGLGRSWCRRSSNLTSPKLQHHRTVGDL
jgi:hypothetical protein